MALSKQGKGTICAAIALIAGDHALRTQFSPLSWAVCSLATWLAFVVCKGWGNLSRADKYQLIWAVASSGFWLHFITNLDPSFQVQACCNSAAANLLFTSPDTGHPLPAPAFVCLLSLCPLPCAVGHTGNSKQSAVQEDEGFVVPGKAC